MNGRVLPESEYMRAFRAYLERMAVRFAGRSPAEDGDDPDRFVRRLEDARCDNARAGYVLFFAWAYSKSYLHYYRREKPDVLRAALKILLVIQHDFLRFNDDCTQEFVSLLIRHAGADEAGAEAEIAREPVVPEAEELIKFVATFVTDLKRRHGLPIRLY